MLVTIIFIGVILTYTSAQGALKKEYKLESYFKANWFDANIFCRDHGMQLATIYVYEDQYNINTLITANGMETENFWISGTDLAKEGRFTWFSTGKIVSYTNWAYGQPGPFPGDEGYGFPDPITGEFVPPDNYDNAEDCILILSNDRRWSANNCTTLNYFICELL